jgi:hypothetical protein
VVSFSNSNALQRRRLVLAGTVAAFVCMGLIAAASASRPDEPLSDLVGVIDGESIAVNGPMSVEVMHGQSKNVLRSGSDVRVNSSSARIDLVDGGQISICGPAHLSVLKSGGSLTIALDTGTIHVHVEGTLPVNVYTPQIQAQTIAIADGPRDALIGFDTTGAMCIRANRGAIRVEQQLSGQTILVPQTGDILLVNAQLDSLHTSTGHCTCELQSQAPPPPQIGQLATAEDRRQSATETKAKNQPAADPGPAKEEPVYQVLMPPLVYDAKSKIQAQFDPNLILVVRRVRVRPTLIFQGKVEGPTQVASATPPISSPAPGPTANSNPTKPPAPANDSFGDRVRKFVKKLWPGS